MVKIPVYLRDMYDAKHLVQIAESCRGDVDPVSYTHLTLPTIRLV